MSKVIMMCGVCGSGKTTYAKKKEQEGYIRLSIDEEMWKLYGRKGIDYPEEQYEKLSEQVEAALQKKRVPARAASFRSTGTRRGNLSAHPDFYKQIPRPYSTICSIPR